VFNSPTSARARQRDSRFYFLKRPNGLEISHLWPMHGPKTPANRNFHQTLVRLIAIDDSPAQQCIDGWQKRRLIFLFVRRVKNAIL